MNWTIALQQSDSNEETSWWSERLEVEYLLGTWQSGVGEDWDHMTSTVQAVIIFLPPKQSSWSGWCSLPFCRFLLLLLPLLRAPAHLACNIGYIYIGSCIQHILHIHQQCLVCLSSANLPVERDNTINDIISITFVFHISSFPGSKSF